MRPDRPSKRGADHPGDPWDRFPRTRYLGSKRKLLGLLAEVFDQLEFDTALDPFCGTGAVAYLLKGLGKRVTAADSLEANVVSARALVENHEATIGDRVDELLDGLPDPTREPGFVEQTFDELFFEREENRFIDQLLPRIAALPPPRRDLMLHALFQACLAKRPYNLFHRANLALRRRDVERSFGNKKTWDTPFPVLIARYAAEADRAVFDSGRQCRAVRADALEHAAGEHDLVYLDPPYVSAKGSGVDYLDYYHFLEGLCRPNDWGARILERYKHKPLAGKGESPWSDHRRIDAAFEETVNHYRRALLVVSYRSDGIPSVERIAALLERAGKRVEIVDGGKYTYALSRNRRSREVVLIGR